MKDGFDNYDVPALRTTLMAKMADCAAAYPGQIEQRFPRILARIADLWGTAELDTYLEMLMLSDRNDRQGFPQDIAMELFRLTNAHGALGLAPKTTVTGWAGIDDAALEEKAFFKRSK